MKNNDSNGHVAETSSAIDDMRRDTRRLDFVESNALTIEVEDLRTEGGHTTGFRVKWQSGASGPVFASLRQAVDAEINFAGYGYR